MKTRLDEISKRLSRDESAKIARVLEPVPRSAAVVEVGCGFGRKLELLRRLGFENLRGVEANPSLVQAVRGKGFEAFTPEEFEQGDLSESFDLLVLSHVVEHMDPDGLLEFMERCLSWVRPGGRVLVVTPTGHPHFHLDFDHVKPYYPQGFKAFFGEGTAQVRAPSRAILKLRDIRFRRSPFKIKNTRGLVLNRPARLARVCNFLFALVFFCSRGAIGRTTGWIGLFDRT